MVSSIRAFTEECKAKVVDLIRTTDKSVGAICRELDLTETAVRRWLKHAEMTCPKNLIATCVLHGIDPYAYLVDVL
ncbi:unnamed protein product [marine sediment metagenome]|uniref:Uncharacterized protein n=1 Tax=marine sediment metagenome TaxID=412755 RepID=X0V6G7_9ZZZZ